VPDHSTSQIIATVFFCSAVGSTGVVVAAAVVVAVDSAGGFGADMRSLESCHTTEARQMGGRVVRNKISG
jgi:hypothetical protein